MPWYKNYVNASLNYNGRFRQYGLWERYAELYPEGDLVYTIGVSDYSKDWFFAHVTRFGILMFTDFFQQISF